MKTSGKDNFSLSRRRFIGLSGKAMTLLALPSNLVEVSKSQEMTNKEVYDVIIVGGSYSGLAAGMALGRALRKVLIIDSGMPCNRQTPYSHNFLTNDGKTPGEITERVKQELTIYGTVRILDGRATEGRKTEKGFEIGISSGETFSASKLIFSTGVKDLLPNIKGLAECWGITVLHCPYCHGYEVKNETTGILGNGEYGFEFARLISNWTGDLTVFTNGKATFTEEQHSKLQKHGVAIVEKEIRELEHAHGYLRNIVFTDGSVQAIKAVYTRVPFDQHCSIPENMGCGLTAEGFIQVDPGHKTSIEGIYACGDNVSRMRTVANAVAMGTTTGMMVNRQLVEDNF